MVSLNFSLGVDVWVVVVVSLLMCGVSFLCMGRVGGGRSSSFRSLDSEVKCPHSACSAACPPSKLVSVYKRNEWDVYHASSAAVHAKICDNTSMRLSAARIVLFAVRFGMTEQRALRARHCGECSTVTTGPPDAFFEALGGRAARFVERPTYSILFG
jgi:hypothetical protein